MKQSYVYQPTYFFLTALIITCITGAIAAYASYRPSLHYLLFLLILAGMSSPTISALLMFATSKDKSLWTDFCQRLRFGRIKHRYIPIVLLFVPCLVLLAITISLLFGGSSDQFSLSHLAVDQALEGKSFVAILIAIILSCSLEEMGWRGYGIDSLSSTFNLWRTSLIFSAIWGLWHVPAFFIKNGYFEQAVWNLGMVQVATYFISLIPITFLMNWVYIKNNRSILIAILAHATMNLSYGLFRIEPLTKIIIMVLLLLAAAIIVMRDKEIFFSKPLIKP